MQSTKNLCRLLLLGIGFLATSLLAQPFPLKGPVIHIHTYLSHVTGTPSWLLILRNVETGQVLPYLYDILDNENYWVALPYSHAYRITASRLRFGPFTEINNFCNLENGVIAGKSFFIRVTGRLTPNRYASKCHVMKFN